MARPERLFHSTLMALDIRGRRWLLTRIHVSEAEGMMSVKGRISSAKPILRTKWVKF